MNLNERNWRPFLIGQFFEIVRGNARDANTRSHSGDVSLVSALDNTNAYSGATTASNKETIHQGCITVHNNGNGVGLAFVHSYPFVATSDVSIMKQKKEVFNEYSLRFLATSIRQQKPTFCYGYKLSNSRLARLQVMLPVDSDANPDYAFMEAYMKEQEQKLLKKYIDYQKNNWGGQVLSKPYGWMGYYVSEKANGLFHIASTKSGIDRNKLVVTGEEQFPYITRTDSNNGWDGFVTIQPGISYDVNNVITLGLDTQTAFYQPTPFYTGQNIQVLSGPQINKHVALFVIQMIKLQMRSKFNWGGNGATLGRLHKMKIMLPVKQDGTPDYEYMEAYMKNIEAKQTQAYLAFKQQNA